METIVALSTAAGNGGIAIVRMSGKNSLYILSKIFYTNKNIYEIKSHTVNYGHIKNGIDIIDEVLVTIMKAPNTYTKQDIVEINCHGGIICVKRIIELIIQHGARLAERGEFTKLAFLNGRIDLAEAEAVIDIINAKTELSQQFAINQLQGKLSKKIKELRDEIILMIASIEASIDYPEHDMEKPNIAKIAIDTRKIIDDINQLLKTADTGRIIKNGLETVIIGKPNVGKSSLLNTLLFEERAIVTDIPGTTRDILTESINIDGIPINIVDTAGIRTSTDTIEKIGIEKSIKYAMHADLILFVVDATNDILQEELDLLKDLQNKKIIVLLNKTDLPIKAQTDKIQKFVLKENIIKISLKDNSEIAIQKLQDAIKNMYFKNELNISSDVFITGIRHKNAISNTIVSLRNVLTTIENGFTEDFISIDLQDAYRSLGEITGETLEEDIIDKIFSEFCLGK